MKRMLDQKTIDELSALLSKVSIDEDDIINFDSLKVSSALLYELWLMSDNPLENVFDSEGNSLFPLENNAGKVLAVNEDEDGLVAVEVSGGTKLYQHIIEVSANNVLKGTIYLISNSSTAYSSLSSVRAAIMDGNSAYFISEDNGDGTILSMTYANAIWYFDNINTQIQSIVVDDFSVNIITPL